MHGGFQFPIKIKPDVRYQSHPLASATEMELKFSLIGRMSMKIYKWNLGQVEAKLHVNR